MLRAVFSLALFAHALFLLALAGQLRSLPMIGAAVICAVTLRGIGRDRSLILAAAIITLLFLLALHPPVAFDETLYHLPRVRALAESGQLQFLADNRTPVFPCLHELLCVPLFLLAGDSATHLVSLLQIALTAALLFEWGRKYGTGAGWLAAALFLGGPIVVYLGTIGYVDAALMLFVTAGFYCLDREEYALSGFFLGTACAVKYLGGFFAVAALLIVVWRDRRAAARFIACCAAAALPTTLWLVATTGDPLFPFLRESPWKLVASEVTLPFRVPWDVTFARDRAGLQPPFTPFFIAMIAAVFAASLRDRRARALALIVVTFLAIFSFLPQDSRYLVSLLPLLSIASAAIVASRWPKAVVWLALIAIAPGVLYAAYRYATYGPPPFTAAARREVLLRRVPEYAALERADAGTMYVCGGEQLKYHAKGLFLGDFAGPFSYERVLGNARTTSAIAANLRTIDGRWFLVAKRACPPPLPDGGMELVFEDRAAQLWRVQSSPQRR